jgi:hypothetical protein
MIRTSAGLIGVLVLAGAVRADVPPAKGQVRVPVDHVIETDMSYPDYVFVVVVGGDAGWSYKAELATDKPLRIDGAGRGGRARLCWLAAVPAEAAKGFKTDKELVLAVVDRKVPGLLTSKGADLDSFTVVPEKDAPKVVEEKHRVERLNKDEGIVLSAGKAGLADPGGRGDESGVRWVVAGVAAAVTACGLGLWLFGRKRG